MAGETKCGELGVVLNKWLIVTLVLCAVSFHSGEGSDIRTIDLHPYRQPVLSIPGVQVTFALQDEELSSLLPRKTAERAPPVGMVPFSVGTLSHTARPDVMVPVSDEYRFTSHNRVPNQPVQMRECTEEKITAYPDQHIVLLL